jgi:hypothetical protein
MMGNPGGHRGRCRLFFLKKRFTALLAYPCRHVVQCHMAGFAVDMERSVVFAEPIMSVSVLNIILSNRLRMSALICG